MQPAVRGRQPAARRGPLFLFVTIGAAPPISSFDLRPNVSLFSLFIMQRSGSSMYYPDWGQPAVAHSLLFLSVFTLRVVERVLSFRFGFPIFPKKPRLSTAKNYQKMWLADGDFVWGLDRFLTNYIRALNLPLNPASRPSLGPHHSLLFLPPPWCNCCWSN